MSEVKVLEKSGSKLVELSKEALEMVVYLYLDIATLFKNCNYPLYLFNMQKKIIIYRKTPFFAKYYSYQFLFSIKKNWREKNHMFFNLKKIVFAPFATRGTVF